MMQYRILGKLAWPALVLGPAVHLRVMAPASVYMDSAMWMGVEKMIGTSKAETTNSTGNGCRCGLRK